MANSIGQTFKTRRLAMGLTLEELSEKSGFSIGYLSKIERSEKKPPFSTMQTLAFTLNLDLADLLDNKEHAVTGEDGFSDREDIAIVRDCSATVIAANEPDGNQTVLLPLTTAYRNRNISPFMMYVNPGRTEIYHHDAEECNYVVKGPVKLEYDGKTYILNDGDCFYFDSRKDHCFVNENDYMVMVLSVVFLYRRF